MHALWIASGIAVWGLHFTAVYGLTALACARGHADTVPWIIGASALAAAALTMAILIKGYLGRTAFIEWMTASVAAFALIGIVYETAAGLLSPLCG